MDERFTHTYNNRYMNFKHNIEIVVDNDKIIEINIPDIDYQTTLDWLYLNDDNISEKLITNLINWIIAQRNPDAPGFNDEEQEDNIIHDDFVDIEITKDRNLTIYTRGRAIMKNKPTDSQCSFNAGVLNCRGGGVDLRKMNGLSEEVQQKLLSSNSLSKWLTMAITKIENNDYHTVDVVCTKGRHRSVAVAELLKSRYYLNAEVYHLTIK